MTTELSETDSPTTSAFPELRVVSGNADPEEIAALTALFAAFSGALGAQGAGEEDAERGLHERQWRRRHALKLAPEPGGRAWRRSAWR